jgi:phosphate transport system substrate-binding protein
MINRFQPAQAGSAVLLGFVLVVCSGVGQQAMAEGNGSSNGATLHIKGAGATFPKPLYERWMQSYADVQPEVRFSYEGVGSGEGIKRFLAEDVDFGASDAAMSDADLAKVGDRGALMVPMTAGMVVLAYNLPGVDALNLTRDAVIGIFSGEIRSWDDPRIQVSNPGVALPNKTIAPVVRRDSSGTTFIFTNHLSATSDWWRNQGPGAASVSIGQV